MGERRILNPEVLERLVDALPILIARLDADQIHVYANRAYAEWVGRAPAQIIGKSLKEVIGEVRYRIADPLILATSSGQSADFNFDPTTIFQVISDGEDQGTVLYGRPAVRAADADPVAGIPQSEGFLESLIENIPNMIFVKDAKDLRFLRFNRAGEELLGFSQAELLGKNDYDFFPKEEADAFIARDRRVIENGVVDDILEEPISTRHGPRVLHTKKLPIFGPDGTPRYLLGISEDITEKKKQEVQHLTLIQEQAAREEAEKSAARLSVLADASAVLGQSLDYETTLESVAKLVVSRLSDWCWIDILNPRTRKLENLIVAHRDPQILATAKSLRRLYPLEFEVTLGAPRVLASGVSELLDDIPRQLHAAGTLSDRKLKLAEELGLQSGMIVPLVSRGQKLGTITLVNTQVGHRFEDQDLRLAEQLATRAAIAIENSRLYSELQEALLARDEFLSICSHELKTPVTSLKLQSQMAFRQIDRDGLTGYGPEKVRNLIKNTDRQMNRMIRLIEDMLDVSRIATGKLSMKVAPLDLEHLIRGVVERSAEFLKQSATPLDLQLAAGVIIMGDSYRIEQVIMNLLTNAVKYGQGHPVRISLQSPLRGGHRFAQIQISDQGMGIAKENHERIFKRFERAVPASSISGIGLGLYIVNEIVQAHGGNVRVQSELGQGSTFTIELPCVNH